jgi:hypothetical protein
LGPGEEAQGCDYGLLQVRVTVVDTNGVPLGGIWVHDRNSGAYQITGHKADDPFWGPGDAQFDYYKYGGGSMCIATGEGGTCLSDYTREMSCFYLPSIEDLHAAGYCDQCCEPGATVERCRQLTEEGKCFPTGAGHFAWHAVFTRSW